MIKVFDFTLHLSATFFVVIKYRIILLNYNKIRCVYFFCWMCIVDSHPVTIKV